MDFTHRLGELMSAREVTAYKLCKELSLGKSNVAYWLEGRTFPDGKTLIRLADYFGVSIDYLVGRSNDPRIEHDHSRMNELDWGVLDGIKSLTDEQKKEVLDFIRFKKTQGDNITIQIAAYDGDGVETKTITREQYERGQQITKEILDRRKKNT